MGSRIPSKPRDQLSSQEQADYDEFTQIAEHGFGKNGEKFLYKDKDGSWLGPYPLLMAAPKTGKLGMELVYSFGELPLPTDVKETAILACGGHFQAAYELYAHEAVATGAGVLSKEQVEVIKQGQKPQDLNENCSLAFDVAKRLCGTPGPLPQEYWDKSVQAFGKDGTVALVHYVGFYAYICIALNAADAPVPE
ncbi:hypothetical protein PRZ48_004164 [Zasmidium cellare]|uniref:Carboxymuconolactone decarboxylase-like domain-containing protein n=1 Tax=Zasmidium cellare TaxID=395010 RepID=A0ABR0EX24_ZASCE|nr:hypothetical protein PRZ48_004164 [Zasmidium cellare]